MRRSCKTSAPVSAKLQGVGLKTFLRFRVQGLKLRVRAQGFGEGFSTIKSRWIRDPYRVDVKGVI